MLLIVWRGRRGKERKGEKRRGKERKGGGREKEEGRRGKGRMEKRGEKEGGRRRKGRMEKRGEEEGGKVNLPVYTHTHTPFLFSPLCLSAAMPSSTTSLSIGTYSSLAVACFTFM